MRQHLGSQGLWWLGWLLWAGCTPATSGNSNTAQDAGPTDSGVVPSSSGASSASRTSSSATPPASSMGTTSSLTDPRSSSVADSSRAGISSAGASSSTPPSSAGTPSSGSPPPSSAAPPSSAGSASSAGPSSLLAASSSAPGSSSALPDGGPPLDAGLADAGDLDGGVACGPGRCVIRVVDGHFEKDGERWMPTGAVVTGFIGPASYLGGVYANAYSYWGAPLVAALRDLGANSVRFNVGVSALDPLNPFPDGGLTAADKAVYLQEIVDAVHLVEAHGMNVILTMASAAAGGDENAEERPGPATVRAWDVLARPFVGDDAVILNAFNEPNYGGAATIDVDQTPWLEWRDGYAAAVAAIRATGATNVIMLDGISASRVWRANSAANIPADPLDQLAYDIHPFPTDPSQRTGGGLPKLQYVHSADVDHWLGGWCDTRACAATAFFTGIGNDAETGNCYDATSDAGVTSPGIVADFASYFQARGVGIMVFALDWKNRVFEDPQSPTQSTRFVNFVDCTGPRRMGPAKALGVLWKTGVVPDPLP